VGTGQQIEPPRPRKSATCNLLVRPSWSSRSCKRPLCTNW